MNAINAISSPSLTSTRECVQQSAWLSTLAQQSVLRRLSVLEGGRILIENGCDFFAVGQPGDDELCATIRVHNDAFWSRLAGHGSLGLAESFLEGEWTTDDLPPLFRIFARNLNRLGTAGRGWKLATAATERLRHLLARNTPRNSRRNIEAHYDLGNDFFQLFLDPTLMYSSAMFEQPDMTLEEAQVARLNRICEQLRLQPTDHLLEIGTGWGGLALHAAKLFGCRVTTTTISPSQHDFAVKRIADEGLSERVTVLLTDYRDLTGAYDKLVSVEMIEAVGHQFYDTYFSQCARLLEPGGRMLLQSIVIPEQRYSAYLKSVDFIQKYIFPGGSLPSIAALQSSVTRTTDLRLLALDDFAAGYAETLRQWRQRYLSRLGDVKSLGYSERFIRMWDYYLAYCEGAFEERAIGVVHAMWGR